MRLTVRQNNENPFTASFHLFDFQVNNEQNLHASSDWFQIKGVNFIVQAFLPSPITARYVAQERDLEFHIKRACRPVNVYNGRCTFIDLDVVLRVNGAVQESKKSFRSCNPYDLWESMVETKINVDLIYVSFRMEIKFNLLKTLLLSSPLANCMNYPRDTNLFMFLNDPELSDVCFRFDKSEYVVFAIKRILSQECEFFEKMLGDDWQTTCTKTDPILITGWSKKSFLLCILHLYTGWLPNGPPPAIVATKFGLDAEDPLTFNMDEWIEVATLAKMLELDLLNYYSLTEAKKNLETEISHASLAVMERVADSDEAMTPEETEENS